MFCAPLSSILQEKKKTSGQKGSFNNWTERRNWVRNAGVRYGQMRSQKKPKGKYFAKCFEWLGGVKESCARLKSRKKHVHVLGEETDDHQRHKHLSNRTVWTPQYFFFIYITFHFPSPPWVSLCAWLDHSVQNQTWVLTPHISACDSFLIDVRHTTFPKDRQ